MENVLFMEENKLENGCSFAGIKPIMLDLPYPPIEVSERNLVYADLINVDYCGAVSEMSTIMQFINNENRLVCEKCSVAQTLLGMAICEMTHLQKLGELILLLGGSLGFTASGRNGRPVMWTPSYLNIPSACGEMLEADIECEKLTINQYEMHISWIEDECVKAVLRRIIQDEEYHIMILRTLMRDL